jgi:hypothetical protein
MRGMRCLPVSRTTCVVGRDQYLTFRDQDVNVFWNGRNGNAEPVRGPDGKPIKNSVGDSDTSSPSRGRTCTRNHADSSV